MHPLIDLYGASRLDDIDDICRPLPVPREAFAPADMKGTELRRGKAPFSGRVLKRP